MPNRPVHALIAELMEVRRAWRLTQAEVAERSGVSHRTVSETELGNSSPHFDNLCLMADALGYEITLRPKQP